MRSHAPGRAWALRRAAGPALLLLLGGCNALIAQNPGSAMRPVNAVRLADEPRLMLGGRDVVAYFTGAGSVAGRAEYRVEYGQVAFLFANADHRILFQANPQAYLPAYHGYCADGMLAAVPRVADPAIYAVIDDRLFLFADADAKARFLRDPAAHVARADDLWRQQVRGRNADWLRLQRWLDPLPAAGAGPMPAAG